MPNMFAALAYLDAGLSLLPILPDGSKSPAIPWKQYQAVPPEGSVVSTWCLRGPGLGIICGAVSGHLEVLDFDAHELFAPWCDLVEEQAPGLVQRLPVVKTPSDGRHVFYRCLVIAGNTKLAQVIDAHGQVATAIETRGEGGYVIAPGSPPACHPLGKPYVLIAGDLTAIPAITTDERALMWRAAKTFNAYTPPQRTISPPKPLGTPGGDRPGDLYNARMTWPELLEPHGWIVAGQRGEVTLWKRPGKRERGWSATPGHGQDLFYVFSTNAPPFQAETAYSKFAAYALLAHGGDFTAAAKALAA
jgi:Bifunctional DNA primase/polymerase, N-terminal